MSAQCVMICSGKGGTGKSTVSVLLGAGLARLGRKVLLVELDSGLRSVDIIAGVYGARCTTSRMSFAAGVNRPRPSCPARCTPGFRSSAPRMRAARSRRVPLDGCCRPCGRTLILSCWTPPPGWVAPFTAAATVADRALLVLTPDPVALRDGKIVADRLLAGGRPQNAVRLVMNRVTRDSFGKRASVEDLDECIDTVGAQLIAVIPESVALQQAGAAGTVPPAHDAAVVAGQALAKRLCGQRVPLTF